MVDLLVGMGRPGPSIPTGTSELVDLSAAAPGWIGVERRVRDRTVAAVVQGTSADADIDRLGSGDLIAWGPVAGVWSSPATDGSNALGARRSGSAW
jgi:hypothetical protein